METGAHSTQQRLAAVFAILRITMIGALLVIMAGIACPSLAWELPKGTNKSESLTPEQARKLVAEFRPDVHADVPVLALHGLTMLNAATAKELAAARVDLLTFDGLASLNAAAAKALAEFQGDRLFLDGLKTIDNETAKALSKFKGSLLSLNGLTSIDVDAASAIAEFRGKRLRLTGVITIDDDVAHSLSTFKGELWMIDVGAAKTLVNTKAWIGLLPKLAMLDAATAQALAESEKWDGRLPAVTAFDSPEAVVIAKALATRKGPLALPNLKKISPKTLSALVEKRDVEIPLIETLELIAEPDGSPTEDFVIPEWLEGREQARKSTKPN